MDVGHIVAGEQPPAGFCQLLRRYHFGSVMIDPVVLAVSPENVRAA